MEDDWGERTPEIVIEEEQRMPKIPDNPEPSTGPKISEKKDVGGSSETLLASNTVSVKAGVRKTTILQYMVRGPEKDPLVRLEQANATTTLLKA